MDELAVYGGLFMVAFAAATVLPMQSEAALAGLLLTGSYPPAALLTIASVGNVLGSVANWLIGRGVARLGERKGLPVGPASLERAMKWYQRYGRWSLLLSWVPIVGDPLTVVAGVLREPFWSFVALVAVAKFARYLMVAAAVWSWV